MSSRKAERDVSGLAGHSDRVIAGRPHVAVKQLNGIFRAWMCVGQPDRTAPPIIWAHCIVHLANPEFSGRVLHTSGVLTISDHGSFKIAETRNSYYVLLGPECHLPEGSDLSPEAFLQKVHVHAPRSDAYASASANADCDCGKCKGTGLLRQASGRFAICDRCCRHNLGWWLLEGAYGADNGHWACKAGCGTIVDEPPEEIEFLPRAVG
jgi:hypothetical protein